jgi:hypothetical protein
MAVGINGKGGMGWAWFGVMVGKVAYDTGDKIP